jgi:hypothetical protein
MQKWLVLHKEDKGTILKMMNKIKTWTLNLKPGSFMSSDVVEL